MDRNMALQRCMKICSTKEYAKSEIVQKLTDWGLNDEDCDWVILTLKEEKFLDEFRFARYYVNDKIKFNKWGRIKISIFLKQKKVDNDAVKEAFAQINEVFYTTILTDELRKKFKTIKETDDYTIRGKLYQFAVGRGFEGDLIYKTINELLKK